MNKNKNIKLVMNKNKNIEKNMIDEQKQKY